MCDVEQEAETFQTKSCQRLAVLTGRAIRLADAPGPKKFNGYKR